MSSDGKGDEESKLDTNLYSRQLGVYGIEAMGKLIKMDVLVVGMKGIGIEAAKNLVLAGPRSVTVFDPEPATVQDLGANFFLTEADVGAPRAAAVVSRLAELNSYVAVQVLSEASLTEEVLDRFHAVVFTNTPRSTLVRFNEYCHAHEPPIAFVAADSHGPAAYAFSDFGPKHKILDTDGEPLRSAIVNSVTQGKPGTVITHDGKRHGLADGDWVTFSEVEGMVELNDGKPRQISNVKAHSFDIEDTSAYSAYVSGGVVEQVKMPVVVKYGTLRERIVAPVGEGEPSMITPDYGKFGRPEQLHAAFQAVDAFLNKHGALPELHSAEHAAECVALAEEFNAGQKEAQAGGAEGVLVLEEVDADVVKKVAMLARAEVQPMAAVFGGIIAQEVVKATGKFSPLNGWLYLDAFEILPPEPLPAEEVAPLGGRTDHSIALFGRAFVDKVANLRTFLVGAGALGCEFLKAFALMGVGTGPKGQVTVTDMDTIEVSNLNRQFLFRSKDVGKPKSGTAGAAARAMNPALNVVSSEVPVGTDTEDTWNDAFWEGLDLVVNALDNIKARLYVDGRCVFFLKPLLESGTLGTKTNTQVIMPHKTESYGDSVDPPEDTIAMCTLRHFPNQIEHCIEWARDMFEGSFTSGPQDACSFIKDPAGFIASIKDEPAIAVQRAKLEGVHRAITASRSATFEQCVIIARKLFHEHHYLNIRQLLHNFPADYADPKTGHKFWSGPKRAPAPLVFDASDPLHFAYCDAAAHLAANTFGVKPPAGSHTAAVLAPMLERVSVPEFAPRAVKIKSDEKDTATEEGGEDDAAVVERLVGELRGYDAAELARLSVVPQEFEKDDDTNHHVDFIAAAANARARNYTIKEASTHKVKMIAGKIIPAIATTTAIATGLVSLELYKVVANADLEATRNSFVNLAMNIYSMSEPMPPKKTESKEMDIVVGGPVRALPEGFTSWDKEVVREGDLTVDQFCTYIKTKLGVDVSMISAGDKMLYAPLFQRKHAERKDKPLREVWETLHEKAVTRDYIMLDLSVEDDDGDVVIPRVQFYWR